jgi:UDP-N-acetyl-2-amino-2-deoxyglucuronate dehydrogenase
MFNIGLVGCGRISQKHFEVIEQSPDFKLAGVCDIDKSKAESVGTGYDVPYFYDLDNMLDNCSMDILAICTPSGLHPDHGIKAACRGINVLTEKPMAVRLKDADRLIDSCIKNKVKLFVVLQNRLNPPVVLLKKAIDKGRFGKIYMINATVRWTRPQEYYDLAQWRGTKTLDGGAFMNQASHYVDLVQWFGGPFKEVKAILGTLARNIETEDSGAAVIRFENNAIGVIEVTMCTYPKNYEGSITVLGEKGTVKIGGTAVNKIEHWQFADYDDDDKMVDLAFTDPPSIYGFGHTGYYANAARTLKGEIPAHTDGREGRKSLALINAICG